jgi:hypothetical protein
VTEVEFKKY